MSVNRQSKKNHRNLKKKKKKKKMVAEIWKILSESGKSRQDMENHAGI